jgi:hypothetical protein
MRHVSSLIASLALAALPGCTTYRAVETGAVPPATAVRANFDTPRAIVVHEVSGDSIVVDGVTRVEGVLIERTPETLTLEPARVQILDAGRIRTVRYGAGAFIRIPTQAIERRETKVLGTVILASVLVLCLAIVISAATAEPDPPPPPKDSTKSA